MACCSLHFHLLPLRKFSNVLPKNRLNLIQSRISSATTNNVTPAATATATAMSSCSSFSWDDVLQIPHSQNFSSDLQGFFDKIKFCNRGSENLGDFMPFVIENQVVGYVHDGFADHLRKFQDIFTFPEDNPQDTCFGDHVKLHPLLKTPQDRTRAVADVVKCLGEELIPGIRNELYPVLSSFGRPAFFSLERAAAPYFGIKAWNSCSYEEEDENIRSFIRSTFRFRYHIRFRES